METHILKELEPTNKLLDVLYSQLDDTSILVENNGVRICQPKNSEISPSNIQLGYNVACFLYLDVILHQEFLFLLKNNGDLQILNFHLQVIDTWKTRIKQDCIQKETFICVDANNKRLYVNLYEEKIHCIELVHEKKSLRFSPTNDIDNHCIYHFASSIVQMDFTIHYNAYSMEEFHSIAVLLKDAYHEHIYFRTIYVVNPTSSKILFENWVLLVENVDTSIKLDQYSARVCQLSTVPNMGFFIFTSRGFNFLTLPNGPQNHINNNIIKDIYKEESLFVEVQNGPYDEDNDKKDEINTAYCPLVVSLDYSNDLIKFHILTTSGQYIVLQYKKIHEEEMKYVLFWEQSYANFNLIRELNLSLRLEYDIDRLNKITSRCFKASNNKLNCSILLNDDKLLVGSLKSLKPNSWKTFNYVINANYNNIMTSSFDSVLDDLVFCGNHASRGSFIQYYKTSFNDHYRIQPSSHELNFEDDIITSTSVLNTLYDKCCITKDGCIKWSNCDKTFKISSFSPNDLYIISSIVSIPQLINYTYLVQNNVIRVIKDYTTIVKTFNLGQENITINDITLFSLSPGKYHIWLTDLHGMIFILDKDDGFIINQFKLHYKELKIMNLNHSLLMYHKNIIIKIWFNKKQCQYNYATLLGGPNIYKQYNNSIIVVGKDKIKYKLIDSWMDEANDKLQKTFFFEMDVQICSLLRLSPSSPYVIINSYSNYESKLILFDLNKENVIDEIYVGKCLITDMISIKYLLNDEHKRINTHGKSKNNIDGQHKNTNKILNEFQLAEKIIMDQCFIISLNYEMSEFEDNDNLMIFMLDDDIDVDHNYDGIEGKLIEMKRINSNFNVSKMCNYQMNNIIVVGDKIKIYEINYSMKWDTFVVKDKNDYDDNVNIGSYIKQIIIQPHPQYDNLIMFDLLNGIYQFKIMKQIQKDKYHIQREIKSKEIAILQDINNLSMITNLQYARSKESQWFIMSHSYNNLRIYHLRKDDEIDMIEIILPNVVLNIDSCKGNDYLYKYSQYNKDLGDEDMLFYVDTTCHGLFSISNGKFSISDSEKKNLRLQMKFICDAEEDEEDEDEFSIDVIDFRILKINI